MFVGIRTLVEVRYEPWKKNYSLESEMKEIMQIEKEE